MQYILENPFVHLRQGKLILKKPQKQVSAVDRDMDEHPKNIEFFVANHQEIANDEVDALGVSHGGEMVGDAFEYFLKSFFFVIWEVACAIDIFFDLGKLLLLVNNTVLLNYVISLLIRISFFIIVLKMIYFVFLGDFLNFIP